MEIIAAPARQLKTWSMRLTIITGLFNIGAGLLQALSDLHVMSSTTFAIVNSCLVAAIAAVRFVAQQIPVTEDEKIDLVRAAAAAPMKKDEPNIAVKIDGQSVPSALKAVP